MTAIWPSSATTPAAVWSGLDRRAVAGWAAYTATGAAEADGAAPPVLTTDVVADTETTALRLAELITAFPERAFGGDRSAWLGYLRLPPEEAELIAEALEHPHLAKVATAFLRPDLLVTEGGLRLVGLDVAAAPAGLSACARHAAAAAGSGFARHLAGEGLRLHRADTARIWLEVFGSLLRATGDGPLHVFAVTDGPAGPTGDRYLADLIRSGGYRIGSGTVHDLELTDEGAYFEGQRMHVVLAGHPWEQTRRSVPPAVTRRLMQLDAAGKVDFIGSPAAALYDSKANLALLFDARARALLTAAERELVRAHIPETRILDACSLDWALAQRNRLVCKPAAAHGGEGIAFGPAYGDAEWAAELRRRLADPGRCYVVQRREPLARVTLPGAVPAERELVLAPLLFGARPAGILVRHAAPRADSAVSAREGAETAGALTLRRTTPLG
ncbi:hypothetical protein ACIRBX_01260 [Kitasatospora sp. NPDC096147]|uniref:hypothetical protein n=1 Tax=Kitasatospora sp. NPDC096147 TaxID=3364093 RepID=UPI0038174DF8